MIENILKAYNHGNDEFCGECFSWTFLKIFRAAIFKEKLLMDVPYFIKEYL